VGLAVLRRQPPHRPPLTPEGESPETAQTVKAGHPIASPLEPERFSILFPPPRFRRQLLNDGLDLDPGFVVTVGDW
jgi:hypothetical protein